MHFEENPKYLSEQLITCIGNKRRLLPFIDSVIKQIRAKEGGKKLRSLDLFSGSGVVARYLKQHSSLVIANDLEPYSRVINNCYLSSAKAFTQSDYLRYYSVVEARLKSKDYREGFIRRLYAPQSETDIQPGERVFYTVENALILDTMSDYIEQVPEVIKTYFLAPLLSEASIHSNTAGVFKGFYKNKLSKVGQYGGTKRDALSRITSPILLQKPVFSNFECAYEVYQNDANELVKHLDTLDLAYLDPPYNQHPYGSNYFMLNLLVDYQEPQELSQVAGIPRVWNKSAYNRRSEAFRALSEVVNLLKAKYILISYNSEGFIAPEQMQDMLQPLGEVQVFATDYNTFRASRNLHKRDKRVKEYLYLLKKG
ncbi:MAG: DNA adenine methylase [Candidatus Cloacimonetes bacterium]|nr:DNA adenine methylase [Candidatus Cloacimonadota bacterium]